jgi:hypothetical protein
MPSTINAQTTPFAAVVTTADGTGNLALQTANVTALTIDTNQNATFANVVSATTFVGAANASSLSTGTVATARLATGTANSSTYLRGDSTWAALSAPNNGTLTMSTSGTGLSGSATFTADQSGNSTFTVTSNATNANTAGAIVARDGSGNFSAGTITATTFSGSGASLTSLNASNLSSGTVGTARLASGTANSGTYLRGDQTWASVTVDPPFTGQTYANYAGSRSPGTTYTNSTGKAICIWVGWQNANSRYCQLIVGGNVASQFYGNNYSWAYGFAIVPNGATYSSNANGQSITYWYELR